MAKYICKAKDYSESEISSDSVYVLHIQSERYPYEVAKFLNQIAGKRVANLFVSSMFEIPDIWDMDNCEMYNTENKFSILFSENNGFYQREISIEKVDCEYTDIDSIDQLSI